MNFGQLIGISIGAAAVGVSVWAACYNWVALIQALRGIRMSSPMLFVAPLFAFIAGSVLAGALPQPPPFPLWLPGMVMLFIDPGSIPIVAWLSFKRDKR